MKLALISLFGTVTISTSTNNKLMITTTIIMIIIIITVAHITR